MSEPQAIVVRGDAGDAFREHFKINSAKEAQAARTNSDTLWKQRNPWNDPPYRVHRDIFDWAADQVVKRFLSGRYKPLESPQEAKHFSKGNKLAARQSGSFKAVSSTPDVCKTPCGAAILLVPYPVIADLSGSTGVALNVRFNGKSAYTLNKSTVPTCMGDEAGCATGVKSGTVGGEVKPTRGSGTVKIGGNPIIRDDDPCTMNNGNCTGTYVTVPQPATSIGPDGKVIGDANPPPEEGVMHQVGNFFKRVGSNTRDAATEVAKAGLWVVDQKAKFDAGIAHSALEMVKSTLNLADGVAKLQPTSMIEEGISRATGLYQYTGYTDTLKAAGNATVGLGEVGLKTSMASNLLEMGSKLTGAYNYTGYTDTNKALADAITKHYVDAANQNGVAYAAGMVTFDIGSLFIGGGGGVVGKAGEVGSIAGKAGEAAGAASKVGKGGEAANVLAKAGDATQIDKASKIGEVGPAGDGLKLQASAGRAPESGSLSRGMLSGNTIRKADGSELITIPAGVEPRRLSPPPSYLGNYGYEYKWLDESGKPVKVRIHDVDPHAPAGSNAAEGWVVRIFKGTKSMDGDGALHPPGIFNRGSPYYNEQLINDVHISIENPANFPGVVDGL